MITDDTKKFYIAIHDKNNDLVVLTYYYNVGENFTDEFYSRIIDNWKQNSPLAYNIFNIINDCIKEVSRKVSTPNCITQYTTTDETKTNVYIANANECSLKVFLQNIKSINTTNNIYFLNKKYTNPDNYSKIIQTTPDAVLALTTARVCGVYVL